MVTVDTEPPLNGNLSVEIQDINDPPQIVGSDLNQITVEENTVFVRSYMYRIKIIRSRDVNCS